MTAGRPKGSPWRLRRQRWANVGLDAGKRLDRLHIKLKRSLEETHVLRRELDARVLERTEAARAAQLEAQRMHDDLRTIIDGLSDAVIVVGLDQRIHQVNRAAQALAGGGESPVGRFCYEVYAGMRPCQPVETTGAQRCRDRGRPPKRSGRCPISEVAETGEPVKVTHVYCDRSGQERYIDLIASPLRDANGKITRIVESLRDVTEERRLEASLIRRNQQQSILNAVATAVNGSLDLESILEQALDAVLRLTSVDAGAIFLRQETLGNLQLAAHCGLSEETARLAAQIGLLDGSCGGVIEHGRTVVVPGIERYRGARAESLKREKLNTLVHVPLMSHGAALGSMCIATRRQMDFDEETLTLFEVIGNQIAVAIENARLYAEVQHKEHIRGELLKKVISAQEEERKRIARELHDDTSQALTALLYAAESAEESEDLDGVRETLAGMRTLVQTTLDGVHKVIFDLRPSMLDHFGLVPALRWLATTRLEPLGVQASIETQAPCEGGQPACRLPSEMETALFRVVQEAISNIARHAMARNVRIILTFEDGMVTVSVEDDGVGFDLVEVTLDPDSGRGLGLMGMEERVVLLGGDMQVDTAPGQGTRLYIQMPIAEEETAHG